MMRKTVLNRALCGVVLSMTSVCVGQEATRIGIEERLGDRIPLEGLSFFDEDGRSILLEELLDRPVVLTLVYYRCPGICTPLMHEVAHVVDNCDLVPGEDYRIVTISFDPRETAELARPKKVNMLATLEKKHMPQDGWRFLTGDAENIRRIAVVPGALIGAIPPVIGYVAADGSPASPLILLVGMFFFVWQIPHFWLILLMCGNQYHEAGLPAVTHVFSRKQLLRITFMWVLATAAAGLVFPTMAHGDVAGPWNLAIVIASFWLAAKAVSILRSPRHDEHRPSFRPAFVQVNAYALVVMICLSLDALQVATG